MHDTRRVTKARGRVKIFECVYFVVKRTRMQDTATCNADQVREREVVMKMWRVGEVAERMGVTVRTLHHYDAVDLLKPSRRASSGYRLYSEDDVARLARVLLLRRLGLNLDEIRHQIDAPASSMPQMLSSHIERLREQISIQEVMLRRLEAIKHQLELGSSGRGSAHNINLIMEAVDMIEKHDTAEQLKELEERRQDMGDEYIADVQHEWEGLFAAFGEAMANKIDPASAKVAPLARRSKELIAMFTGGNPGIAKSLNNMYEEQGGPKVLSNHGYQMDPDLWAYMNAARDVLEDS